MKFSLNSSRFCMLFPREFTLIAIYGPSNFYRVSTVNARHTVIILRAGHWTTDGYVLTLLNVSRVLTEKKTEFKPTCIYLHDVFRSLLLSALFIWLQSCSELPLLCLVIWCFYVCVNRLTGQKMMRPLNVMQFLRDCTRCWGLKKFLLRWRKWNLRLPGVDGLRRLKV